MSEERKISSKKVLRFSIGAVLVAIFMIALAAASHQQNNKAIKGLEVHLNDDHEFSFLQVKDIETLLLKNRNINLSQTAIAKLDLKLMEDVARTNPWVAKADIFVDNRQVLQVNITQREPVARLFDSNGGSFYMDSLLNTMPVSPGYAYPAPVFTNVPVLHQDSLQRNLYRKIAYLSEVIGRDSFWHAQITQVEVQPDQTFVLIPLFGNQRILIGDTAGIEEKLGHLFAFYKNVSGKIGWDKYETLDIRYKNQVVASPSIGWIPPKATDTNTLYEGPAIADATNGITPPRTTGAVAKPVAPAVTTRPKPVPKPVAARQQNIVKVKPAVAKPNIVQAGSKGKDQRKETKTNKDKTKTQSPKYIYPGKHSGNH